jgi:hypothetical protein
MRLRRTQDSVTSVITCNDYLFIPELQTGMTAVDRSRVCSQVGSPAPNIFYCKLSA